MLALIEEADEVLLVASMDIPSIKNLKIGMQTLDLLCASRARSCELVLNRANAKVKLDVNEIERVLGMSAEFPVPADIAVPQSVNRGVPVVARQAEVAGLARARPTSPSRSSGPNAHAEEGPSAGRVRTRRSTAAHGRCRTQTQQPAHPLAGLPRAAHERRAARARSSRTCARRCTSS